MTPERKRKVQDLIKAVASRITIVDEMIDGTRPANPGDAKIYMREVKEGLDKINNMIAIA